MYIFLKKKTIGSQDTIISCENFQLTSGCRIPRNSKIIVIDFRTNNLYGLACCNEIQIFGDVSNTPQSTESDEDIEFHEIESTDTATWYQSSYIMKGFKDAVVDGSSIINSWLSS